MYPCIYSVLHLEVPSMPVNIGEGYLRTLIIYMKKFLDSDWLRAVQFIVNTVQKKGNTVQFTRCDSKSTVLFSLAAPVACHSLVV